MQAGFRRVLARPIKPGKPEPAAPSHSYRMSRHGCGARGYFLPGGQGSGAGAGEQQGQQDGLPCAQRGAPVRKRPQGQDAADNKGGQRPAEKRRAPGRAGGRAVAQAAGRGKAHNGQKGQSEKQRGGHMRQHGGGQARDHRRGQGKHAGNAPGALAVQLGGHPGYRNHKRSAQERGGKPGNAQQHAGQHEDGPARGVHSHLVPEVLICAENAENPEEFRVLRQGQADAAGGEHTRLPERSRAVVKVRNAAVNNKSGN